MSVLITGQLPNEPKTHSVKLLTSDYAVFTGQLPNGPKIHSIKLIRKNFCYNYWSTTKLTQNLLSKLPT